MFTRLKYKLLGLRGRCQRFLRGWAYGDVWNIDFWFMETLEPMLRHLQENHQAHPCGYEHEEWTKRIGEMANHLHLMYEENVIKEVFNGDYMKVKEIRDVMMEHKNAFFKMFSEDFYDLWD